MLENNVSDSKFPWKVNSFRFTFFPRPSYEADENLWQKLTGNAPENVSYKFKGQIKHFDGLYNSGSFIIDADPSRIHFIFAPNSTSQELGVGLNLGDYAETMDTFTSIVNKWFSIENCPVVNRLAVGGILFNPVNSKNEGYQQLQKYLKDSVIVDIENSFDFSYSINRPRKSSTFTKNVTINRLSRWSVQNFEMHLQDISVKDGTSNLVSQEFGVNLEFDINTHADFRGEFSLEDQKTIFPELLSHGQEIAEKGDIK